MELLTQSLLLLVFLMGAVAGFVDSIAGGGGLITVPTLLFTGLDPLAALGTNKLQSAMGEITASANYIAKKQLSFNGLLGGLIYTVIGSTLGAVAVSYLPKQLLEMLIPILLLAITVYSIFSKKLRSIESMKPLISKQTFYLACGLVIGFYNGFFGPGVGSIWIVAFIILLGYTVKQASMATKPLNLVGNLSSLVYFIHIGKINFIYGLTMGAGQIVGAFFGSYVVLKNGDRIVRPVFITVCLVVSAKLIYNTYLK